MYIALPFILFALFIWYAIANDPCEGPRKPEYNCEQVKDESKNK